MALLMPIFSIESLVVLRPAVSKILKTCPLILIFSDKKSLVVPATSETIARSSPTKRLNSELLPALGFPNNAISG